MASQRLSWLDARPSVRVVLLSVRNAMRRWPLAAAVLVCAFLALAALGRVRLIIYAIALSALSPRAVWVVTMVLAATVALRRWQHLEPESHRHWLAPLPRDLPLTARAAAVAVIVWAVFAAQILLMAMVARLPVWVPAALLEYTFAGVATGVTLAVAIARVSAWRRRKGAHNRRSIPRSRYSPVRAARAGWANRASLAPVGYWPLVAMRARDHSPARVRSLTVLLLAVPAGAAGGAVLAVAVVWMVVLHLINLFTAWLRSAFSAAWWLAPTPITPMRFALALSYRVVAAQSAACALLFIIGYVTLGPTHERLVTVLTAGWILATSVLALCVCMLALRTRSIAASPFHRWRQ